MVAPKEIVSFKIKNRRGGGSKIRLNVPGTQEVCLVALGVMMLFHKAIAATACEAAAGWKQSAALIWLQRFVNSKIRKFLVVLSVGDLSVNQEWLDNYSEVWVVLSVEVIREGAGSVLVSCCLLERQLV